MGATAAMIDFFRGIRINLIRRPRSPRELLLRLAIVGAVAAAAGAPFLIASGGGSIEDVAGAEFRAALAELDAARAELATLRDANAAPADIQAQELHIAALEERTRLGYLKRDGDAPKEGALIPDFRLLDLDGTPVHLSEIGRPTVVNFWASWCAFCIEEMPDLQRVHELVGDRVTVIGINRGESLSTARRFTDQTGARYTLLLDLDDALGGRTGPYQIVGMPTTFYVGADGRVDTVRVGFHTLEDMTELVGQLLDEAIALPTEPVDTSFAARVTALIDSQRANHAVAGEIFARFAADPAGAAADLAWQRNVIAQTRAWLVNLEALRALLPPSDLAVLFTDVGEAFRLLEVAGTLLAAGAESGNLPQIERGLALFEDALAHFEQAADNLSGVLAAR